MKPGVDEIWTWLEGVPDPEIPAVSVVDLGIIRDVSWQEDRLNIAVSPTYSGCPATSVIAFEIKTALANHGIEDATVETRISPPWTTDWITEAGRKKLLEYGIAPPSPAGGPSECPRCKGRKLEKISQYGSTPCKAQWRCRDCLEPFDYFKCI